MFYKVSIHSGLAWPYSKICEAFSEQDALDKLVDELGTEASFVMTYQEILEERESGQSAEEYIEANNLTCCGNEGVYVNVVNIEKLLFTQTGETAYKSVSDIEGEENRKEFAMASEFNLAAYILYNYGNAAYSSAKEIFRVETLSSQTPYMAFDNHEAILDELAKMLEEDAIPLETFYIPVTWEVCGNIPVVARNLREAMDNVIENPDDYPLPSENSYIDGSFCISCDDEEVVKANHEWVLNNEKNKK